MRRDGFVAGLLMALLALAGCADNETAVARGDRLWADSNFAGALNEYRLAVAQRGDEDALARLAHAFARTGDLEGARQAYDALIDREPRYTAQAAADYLLLARRALRRSDEFGLASAVAAALDVQPEIRLPAFELPIARYYAERGNPDQAMRHYRRTLLVTSADSTPLLLYEMGLIEEARGQCGRATELFVGAREQARAMGSSEHGGRWRTLMTESRWHLGNCAFQLARDARQAGRVTEALERLETVLSLGEPENLLDQAWFDRAETLYGIGRFDEALAAYRRVVDRNPARTGQLVERALRRIDEIRFGTSNPPPSVGPGPG